MKATPRSEAFCSIQLVQFYTGILHNFTPTLTPFLCRLHNDVPGPLCYRSCRLSRLVQPFPPAFRALRRTHQSRPIVGSGGRRCSTCHIHRADAATAPPSAPSTSYLHRKAGYPAPGGTPDLVPKVKADQSMPILHPTRQFARPRLPPKRQP